MANRIPKFVIVVPHGQRKTATGDPLAAKIAARLTTMFGKKVYDKPRQEGEPSLGTVIYNPSKDDNQSKCLFDSVMFGTNVCSMDADVSKKVREELVSDVNDVRVLVEIHAFPPPVGMENSVVLVPIIDVNERRPEIINSAKDAVFLFADVDDPFRPAPAKLGIWMLPTSPHCLLEEYTKVPLALAAYFCATDEPSLWKNVDAFGEALMRRFVNDEKVREYKQAQNK